MPRKPTKIRVNYVLSVCLTQFCLNSICVFSKLPDVLRPLNCVCAALLLLVSGLNWLIRMTKQCSVLSAAVSMQGRVELAPAQPSTSLPPDSQHPGILTRVTSEEREQHPDNWSRLGMFLPTAWWWSAAAPGIPPGPPSRSSAQRPGCRCAPARPSPSRATRAAREIFLFLPHISHVAAGNVEKVHMAAAARLECEMGFNNK